MTPTYRPPIRLAFSAVFWRLMAGFLLLFATALGLMIVRLIPPDKWLIAFLFFMPMYAAWAFFLAATLTVAADLAVRLVVRPRMLAWLAPRADDLHSAFHLDPRERTVAESPARMATGRRSWAPGRLVLTDRRMLFLPNAWDVEPWSVPRDRLGGAWPVEPPRTFWGLVRGIPPWLRVADAGQPRLFALPDAVVWSKLVGGKALDLNFDPRESLLS
jgi:hypothetical protein